MQPTDNNFPFNPYSVNSLSQTLPTRISSQSPPPIGSMPLNHTALTFLHTAISTLNLDVPAIRQALDTFREACATIGAGIVKASKVVIVGVLGASAIFILAKTAALVAGTLATVGIGAVMLTPIGWVYLAMRDKEGRNADIEKFTQATLWPSSQLTTLCSKCLEYGFGENNEIAEKIVLASQRLDVVFTALGVIGGSVAIGATAAVPGLQSGAVAACVILGAILGVGSWRLYSPLEEKFLNDQ